MFFISICLALAAARAETDIDPSVPRASVPRLASLKVVTELPRSGLKSLRFGFQRDSVPVWFGLITSTALLYQYDDDLYRATMAQGRRWNLGNDDKTKTILSAGPYPLLRLPSDTGSALYFLGDGWTHFGIAGAFALTGFANASAPRAWNTGLEIVHGMILSTVFNQAVKRATGRESPNHRTTDPRGAWRPFPSIRAYGQNTPRYDAFPSGHVMTATVTFTVIRANYPEYAPWVWPVQILWTSGLVFQMMNNGVHWASDYPLGIAMGWVVGKMSAELIAPSAPPAGESARARDLRERRWAILPTIGGAGEPMVGAFRRF